MRDGWQAEIESIGADSWALIHVTQLRSNASRESIVAALKADQAWQQNHMDEIFKRFDALIQRVEHDEP